MNRRRGAVLVLAAALVVAACDDGNEEIAETGQGPTTTTEAPLAGLEQPALWPAPDVVFTDPVDAAADFLEVVIGAGEAGEFREGDSRSGEVDAIFAGEGGGREIVRSTLLLRQLGAEDGWFVIAALSPNAEISSPEAGAEVSAGPLPVQGVARGFEATVLVSARRAGAAGPALDEVVTTGGPLETPEPFSASLDLSGAAPGDVITLLVRGDVGIESDPGDFGAIPVVVGPTG